MNYEEFKAKVIEICETNGETFGYGKCRDLIPEISLTEDELRIREEGPAAAGADREYHAKWWTNYCQERHFDEWMASLKSERREACERYEAAREAEWNAKSPEEKAAIIAELERMAEEGRRAKAEYLEKYYEDAARYGRYTGD